MRKKVTDVTGQITGRKYTVYNKCPEKGGIAMSGTEKEGLKEEIMRYLGRIVNRLTAAQAKAIAAMLEKFVKENGED